MYTGLFTYVQVVGKNHCDLVMEADVVRSKDSNVEALWRQPKSKTDILHKAEE